MMTASLAPTSPGLSPLPPAVPADWSDVLHATYARLAAGDVATMDEFAHGLDRLRQALSPAAWRRHVAETYGVHPIRSLIHEEPLTRRAFQKPRGYPGDAPLLDLLYRDTPCPDSLSDLGARLHEWIGRRPACRSVQERRAILANLIDDVARERVMPRILSLACGHLREAERSAAVREGRIREFVAVDQDGESIRVVEREQRGRRVTPVRASIRRFLVAPAIYVSFDFAYAAGLYDYLQQQVAVALTRALFTSLRPGGVMLVANFAPELRDIGYMEAIMDWTLVYRDEAAVAALAARIPRGEIAAESVSRDSTGNVVYLTLRKREGAS